MAITPQSVTKNDVQKGLEANLPPLPLAGDIYVTTDTDKLCICFENGVWTNQEIPVSNPLSVDEGIVLFKENPLFVDGDIINATLSNGNAYTTLTESSKIVVSGSNQTGSARTRLLSTAPNTGSLTPDNIFWIASNGIVLKNEQKIRPSGFKFYGYWTSSVYATLDLLYAQLTLQNPTTSTVNLTVAIDQPKFVKAAIE